MVATARCPAIRTTTGLFATTEPSFFTANKSVGQTVGPTARLAQPHITISGMMMPAEMIAPEHWVLMIQLWKQAGVWPQTLGPPPGRVGCACPGDILQTAGYDVRAA